jgi:hypothetical protein
VVKAASLLVGLVDDAEDGDAAAAVRSALAECAAPQDVIERIVSAATSVANASPESLEDAIVRDAFILTGTELSSGDAVNIRTEGGRLILQRKLSIAAS